MRQHNKKTPTVFYVGVMLLCAFLVTSHMMSGLYARYTSAASNDSSARVAKFEFSDNWQAQSQTLLIPYQDMYPGKKITVPIEIKNNGEVAIKCIVKVENLTGNLPIETKEVYNQPVPMNSRNKFNIEIEWQKSENSLDYAGKVDLVRVTVTVEQVD